MVFTTLMHNIDEEFLFEAYRRTRKDGSPGVNGMTGREYALNLEANIHDLHERMRKGLYVAPPVKRAWIEKEDNSKRPIGIPEFEDKIVQRAASMLLSAVYEQDFYDVSYAFREGRSPHQGLDMLRKQLIALNIGWVVDADVSGFFDNLGHSLLFDVMKQRVNDGGVLRFVGKWLNAGVMEGENLTYSEKGTPQGGVISPLLSNIFLHTVLDEWYTNVVKPRLKGRSFLLRFADDFVIGCELEEDARRVMEVLPKRFERYGLTIHPEKTTLVEFRRPDSDKNTGSGKGTFDFLGFTHYWAKSRRGYWVIKRKTAKKRLRRAMKAIWRWCKYNRHMLFREQYRMVCIKLLGYYRYYGIRGNYLSLRLVYEHVKKAWKYWLSRRSQRSYIPWVKFEKLLVKFPLPRPRIVHSI